MKEKIEKMINDLLLKIHQSIENDKIKLSEVELLNSLFRARNEVKNE